MCAPIILLLVFLCSIGLWRAEGVVRRRRHSVVDELPRRLQQQRPLPVEHRGACRETGAPPLRRFLPGGESAVHERQSQPHRQCGKSGCVKVCCSLLFSAKTCQSGDKLLLWRKIDIFDILLLARMFPDLQNKTCP